MIHCCRVTIYLFQFILSVSVKQTHWHIITETFTRTLWLTPEAFTAPSIYASTCWRIQRWKHLENTFTIDLILLDIIQVCQCNPGLLFILHHAMFCYLRLPITHLMLTLSPKMWMGHFCGMHAFMFFKGAHFWRYIKKKSWNGFEKTHKYVSKHFYGIIEAEYIADKALIPKGNIFLHTTIFPVSCFMKDYAGSLFFLAEYNKTTIKI